MDRLSQRNQWLLTQAAEALGVSKEETLETSLRLLIKQHKGTRVSVEGGVSAQQVMKAAETRIEQCQGFTLDELLNDLYGDVPIFSPHKVKIQMGKMLAMSGYHRKQIRRTPTDRPLWWFKIPRSLPFGWDGGEEA